MPNEVKKMAHDTKPRAKASNAAKADTAIVNKSPFDDVRKKAAKGAPALTIPQLIQDLKTMDKDAYKAGKKSFVKTMTDGVDGLTDSQAKALVGAIRRAFMEEKRIKAPYEVDPEPWSEEVSVLDVVREIESIIRRVMYIEPHYVTAAAYFCLATWFAGYVEYAPYMVITSPDKRCGKSTLIRLMMKLVRRPYVMSGKPSESSLFRTIEDCEPTVIIDEVDTFLKNAPELQGLFNGGINRELAFIQRTETTSSGSHFVKNYSTFGFKIFSGIGANEVGEALVDRAIVVELRRRAGGAERVRVRDIPAEQIENLRRKMFRLSLQYGEQLASMKGAACPAMPAGFDDRSCDKWETLLALADLAEADEGIRVRDAACEAAKKKSEPTWSIQLLADTGAIVERAIAEGGYDLIADGVHTRISVGVDAGAGDYILSSNLHVALTGDREKRWGDFANGRPISLNKTGRTLKKYGVNSVSIRSQNNSKGFKVAEIRAAVDLYAPGVNPE